MPHHSQASAGAHVILARVCGAVACKHAVMRLIGVWVCLLTGMAATDTELSPEVLAAMGPSDPAPPQAEKAARDARHSELGRTEQWQAYTSTQVLALAVLAVVSPIFIMQTPTRACLRKKRPKMPEGGQGSTRQVQYIPIQAAVL